MFAWSVAGISLEESFFITFLKNNIILFITYINKMGFMEFNNNNNNNISNDGYESQILKHKRKK